jgi:hypothetical protein
MGPGIVEGQGVAWPKPVKIVVGAETAGATRPSRRGD